MCILKVKQIEQMNKFKNPGNNFSNFLILKTCVISFLLVCESERTKSEPVS